MSTIKTTQSKRKLRLSSLTIRMLSGADPDGALLACSTGQTGGTSNNGCPPTGTQTADTKSNGCNPQPASSPPPNSPPPKRDGAAAW